MRDGMSSYRLDIALREAIRAHADQHHHSVQNLERILVALGEVTSLYQAELPELSERRGLFDTFCTGIAEAAGATARDQVQAAAPIS